MKEQKIQELLNRLNEIQNQTEGTPKNDIFGSELGDFKKHLEGNFIVKMLGELNDKLDSFKEKINLDSLKEVVQGVKSEIESFEEQYQSELEKTKSEIDSLLKKTSTEYESKLEKVKRSIPEDNDTTILKNIENLRSDFMSKQDFDDKPLKKEIEVLKKQLQTYIANDTEEDKQAAEDLDKRLQKLKDEINRRIATLGGGSMNRAIYINGANPLTRYTDINLKAGSNVTINYANNDTTKKVDITFIATGGGGGGGIARSINSVSTNTNAGSASATDYVYLCSGTMTLTLPDATSGNTNIYTIKNVGTGVVTVNTTSSQTIDGSLTAVLSVQYTSIDVESDSANWNVT